MRLARHDARTLFERAWALASETGELDAVRREALIAEAVRAIRRIASVLGSEFLREDLERARRSMLGLINLHLERVSAGEVAAAARSLVDKGLLFHTKGASQSIKRVLALEHGVEPDALTPSLRQRFEEEVVAYWAHLPYASLIAREAAAEQLQRRRAAAAALSDLLEGEPPEPWYDPEQTILTALTILVYGREPAWIHDAKGFERLLAAFRSAPARFLRLPEGLPAGHQAVIETVWREHGGNLLETIVAAEVPLHQLVAGDPTTNPLHAWLVLPAGDALGDVDALGEQATSHWQALTGGATDDERLLAVMLDGVLGLQQRWPIGLQAAETLLRTRLVRRPEPQAIERWLEANAPHPYHADLLDLWDAFWEAREEDLDAGSTSAAVRVFAREWLPVRAVRRG